MILIIRDRSGNFVLGQEKVDKILQYTKYMNRISTRLKAGKDDIELSTKLPTWKWKREFLPPDLQAIHLQCSPSPVGVKSPPPGRPGLEEVAISKKRQISSDDDTDDVSKKLRGASQDATGQDMVEEEAIQKKAKGGEKPADSSLGPMDTTGASSQVRKYTLLQLQPNPTVR